MRIALPAALALLALSCAGGAGGAGGLPPSPAHWPKTLPIGNTDDDPRPGAPRVGFLYTYPAGGVNTGGGWSAWVPNGGFVTNYIAAAGRAGAIPVFSYYMLRQ